MSTSVPRKQRPAMGESRAERPNKRVRVSGHRDIITVDNKNHDFYYRWVIDKSDKGSRIRKFLQGGYEFVTKENDNVIVGDESIRSNEDLGTLIRISAGPNSPDQYLYLMRIPLEWRDEDTKEEEVELRAREARVFRKDEDLGQYIDVEKRRYGPDA